MYVRYVQIRRDRFLSDTKDCRSSEPTKLSPLTLTEPFRSKILYQNLFQKSHPSRQSSGSLADGNI